MHKRSLLIGFGIGIIVGALLLQLFNIGAESQKNLDQLSNEINGEATPAPDPSLVHEEENGENVTPSSTPEPIVTPDASSPPDPSPVSSLEVENTDVSAPAPIQTPEVAELKQYVLRVKPGSFVSQTAKLLQDNHIISDADSFAAYMKKKETLMRKGYFLVEEKSTNEQIRKLLSSEPLSNDERSKYIEIDKLSIIE